MDLQGRVTMEEHKKSIGRKRWSYVEDFTRTASGEYIYIGPTYCFQGEADVLKRGIRRWGILAVGMVICTAFGGFILAPGTANCAYILIPYALAFLSACSVLWGFVRLAAGKDPLRSYVYEATVKQFPLRTVLTVLGAAAALIGEVVYVILNGTEGRTVGMILFLISEAAALLLALLWRPFGREMKWRYKDRAESR